MKHLLGIVKKYRLLMLVYLLLGLAQAFLQSFGSRYFQTVIDNFTSDTLTIANIVIYGTAMIALYLISYMDEYPCRKLEHGINLSLKTDALRKISVINYLEYVKLGTGALIQRIENGATAGGNILFGFYLNLAAFLLPQMLFSIVFIFILNRAVTVAILLGYVIVFIVTNLLLKVLYKVKAGILVNEEMFNHFLVRGFMEMVVFRVNRRFASEINKAVSASAEIIASKVKMKMIHEAFFTIFAVLVGFVKIGVIVYGWQTKSLTIGEIVAIIALVDNAYVPVAIFNVEYVQYKLDKVAFARYTAFLDAKEDTRLHEGTTVSDIRGDIAFSGVRFGYNDRVIFNGLSLSIKQGASVAFVGESGSGKSSAVKMLAGLLCPDDGTVMVDDYDLSRIELHSYFQHIVYFSQEPAVFDGTLRENIVFDEQIDDAFLLDAIQKVGLTDLYHKLENGLDTALGERGVTLSGGERQQLALARLWFSNARIIILDEATSAIDNLTEELLLQNVMAHLSGKTIIAIAHRLDSIKSFDNIVVFHDGQVVEQGGFEELMKRHSYFYDLYARSLG